MKVWVLLIIVIVVLALMGASLTSIILASAAVVAAGALMGKSKPKRSVEEARNQAVAESEAMAAAADGMED